MCQPRGRGFTLIELMVVVTILAILAAVAVPAYTKQVQRSRRSDAQQFMLQMQTRQQQILIEQRGYASAPNALNLASTGWSCTAAHCVNQYYTVTFNPAVDNTTTPPSYGICAVPGGAQTDDGVLTLSSTGSKQRLTGTACTGGTDQGW